MFIKFRSIYDTGDEFALNVSSIDFIGTGLLEGNYEVFAERFEDNSIFELFRGSKEQCEKVFSMITDAIEHQCPLIVIPQD